MNQNISKLDLLGQVAGSNFQVFVDNVVALRENTVQWKKYLKWGEKSFSTQFSQVEAETSLYPMASVIDTNSPKPKRSLTGIEMYQGEVPKLGHSFDLTEKDLRQYYTLIQSGGNFDVSAILDKFRNTVDKLEFGVHGRLNSMTDMAISTGHIVLDNTNNPDGVITDFDLRVPADNKKYAGFGNGTSVVWTDPTATPLQDLQDLLDYADDNNKPYEVFWMHKLLWRIFIRHPNVVKEVRSRLGNPNATGVISEADMKNFLSDMGFPPVVITGGQSGLETNGIVSNYTGWDESNVVLSMASNLGEVKSVEPITIDSPAVRTAFTEDGRIQIIQSFDAERKIQSFTTEAYGLPTLSRVKNHMILDTSRTSAWS